MNKKVLIAKPGYSQNSPTGYKMLVDKGYDIVHIPYNRDYTLEELIEVVGDIDGIIADSEPWGEEALCAAPKLQVISRYGVGMDAVDVEAVRRHGVICTNCPGVNSTAVAEHAVALLLACMRNLITVNASTKRGEWKQYMFKELESCTVGILGFGYIGQKVARNLMGFGCKVIACDVAPNYEVAKETRTEIVSQEEVLTQSDVICLHVPLTPETFHLINRETLKRTKKGVVFVSEARGPVVDEEAMYEAMVSGHVGAFASDVFENEPATPENTPLMKLDNFIASAHNGGETYENSERCGIMTAQVIIDVFEGREPKNRRV